jgi:RNA polymerase subunit RPABC4/transcription elongation factor Spt4
MPTFKHPCPYCDKFIDRAVRACPYCGQVDPFAPKRCQNCQKIVEDPAWTVCPSCGQSLVAPPPGAAVPAGAGGAAAPSSAATAPTGTQAAAAGPAGAQPAGSTPPTQVPPQRPPLYKDTVAATQNAAPAPQAAGGICSGCGAPLPAGARFCTICGTMAS